MPFFTVTGFLSLQFQKSLLSLLCRSSPPSLTHSPSSLWPLLEARSLSLPLPLKIKNHKKPFPLPLSLPRSPSLSLQPPSTSAAYPLSLRRKGSGHRRRTGGLALPPSQLSLSHYGAKILRPPAKAYP
jgi:hypothetical protein